MDSKAIYETCGAIAEALPGREREVFASLVGGLLAHGRKAPGMYATVSGGLPDVTRPLLLPLIKELRSNRWAAHNAARRWLRDAGWIAR